MARVYVFEKSYDELHDDVWKPVDEDISSLFLNPLGQGEYHLYTGRQQIEELSEKDVFKIDGVRHIASNFGIMSPEYSGITHILNPNRNEGYILLQLSPYAVKITQNIETIITLRPNLLKMMDGGSFYLVEGNFEEIMAESLLSKELIEKEDGELWISFSSRLRDVSNNRVKEINPELVNRINKQRFNGRSVASIENIRQYFTGSIF